MIFQITFSGLVFSFFKLKILSSMNILCQQSGISSRRKLFCFFWFTPLNDSLKAAFIVAKQYSSDQHPFSLPLGMVPSFPNAWDWF